MFTRKIVGLWRESEPHKVLAIGVFDTGRGAIKAVTAYEALAKAKHLKVPWAKDYDVVITGHRTGVVWPETRLDDEAYLNTLVLP